MNYDELTMAYILVHQVWPAAGVSGAIGAAWFLACRWLYRLEERAHQEALRLPTGYETMPLDSKIAVMVAQRRTAGKGSPGDRLFLGGLSVAGVGGLCVLAVLALQ